MEEENKQCIETYFTLELLQRNWFGAIHDGSHFQVGYSLSIALLVELIDNSLSPAAVRIPWSGSIADIDGMQTDLQQHEMETDHKHKGGERESYGNEKTPERAEQAER